MKNIVVILVSATVVLIVSPAEVLAVVDVFPVVETDPANGTDKDSADDACIWVHPTDANLSLIIGQSKDGSNGGIHVYDLNGHELEFYEHGKMNSTDVRYNFGLVGELVDIVVATNRTTVSVDIYKVDAFRRRLERVGTIPTGVAEIYGLCMYHNPVTNKFYAIPNHKDGTVQQWELFDDGTGHVTGSKVREFDIGTQPEGCVADDELGILYIGEENYGVWKYGAEPTDGTARTAVDTVAGDRLTACVEGLTIYYTTDGAGYLLVSSQGSDTFVIYRREGDNDYIDTFRVASNEALGIDGCTQPDGIDVANVNLGPAFPNGLFIAHDHYNTGIDDDNSNFKFVPWDAIANAVSPALTIDTSWNPRTLRPFRRSDLDTDGDIDLSDLRTLLEAWLNTCPVGEWCGGCDIDQNTRVDFFDFAILSGSWTGPFRPGDFDKDGDIDWTDLRTLVEAWLNTCPIGEWCGGRDIDQSTGVDFFDFAILSGSWTGPL
ncbi:MAG: phytase [Planctomycetota bacterium]